MRRALLLGVFAIAACQQAGGSAPSGPERVQTCLRRPSAPAVASCLGAMSGTDADPKGVAAVLDDPERRIDSAVASALSRLGTPTALLWVEAYLEKFPGSIEVIEPLGEADNEPARELLRRLARTSSDETTRTQALRRLAHLRDTNSRLLFRRALGAPYLAERIFAAEGAGELGDQAAIPALQEMMAHDVHRNGRMAAAKALARIGTGTSEARAALTPAVLAAPGGMQLTAR